MVFEFSQCVLEVGDLITELLLLCDAVLCVFVKVRVLLLDLREDLTALFVSALVVLLQAFVLSMKTIELVESLVERTFMRILFHVDFVRLRSEVAHEFLAVRVHVEVLVLLHDAQVLVALGALRGVEVVTLVDVDDLLATWVLSRSASVL